MVDECGDEVVIDTFNMGEELDEDYIELWESMKIEKASQRYPEAQRFYFENSRDMQRLVNAKISGFFRQKDYEDEELETEKMMPCDYSGICAGASCPQFFGCQA